MTSPDIPLTYGTFCGSILDDMLEQVVHSIVSTSLLKEKLIRKNYGTVSNPTFHDPPFFDKDGNSDDVLIIEDNSNVSTNHSPRKKGRYEEEDDDEDDYDLDDEDLSNSKHSKHKSDQIDLTSDDGESHSNRKKQKKNNVSLRYKEPDIGRFRFTLNGKDIYVNALDDNRKLLGSKADAIVTGTAQDLYFQCSNCKRKIAGSRFGAHIDKCLGGRSRK